ncbi:MAG TPA: hypothetical protein VF518_12520 [Polyangia bacterium]
MGKQNRSPLLGYNHNVRYGGRILHVQTEDSGPANPHLFTHLFFEGSILATKRLQYDAELPEDDVRGLMQGQHKQILKELKQGLFDDRLEEFFASRGEVFAAPDQAVVAPAEAPVSPSEAELEVEVEVEMEAEAPQADAAAPPALLDETTPSPGPEILDLDAIPTPPPEHMHTPEAVPLHITRPNIPGPGTYTFRRPTRDIASVGPSERGTLQAGRNTARQQAPAAPASPVVVQRRIVVGASPKPQPPARPMAPRPRRPSGGVPYVVQEGSHPNLVASRQADPGMPPATSMAEATDADAAPRTAAPPPVPQEPESLVSTRSLDDVILAYLSKGDQKR